MENNNIKQQNFQDTLKDFYINYAYETIKERAIPNVNDGLKPVNLRILYSMDQLGLTHRAKTLKCARVVGDAMGKFHAHGDSSIYGALVTQSQDWTTRYPTIYIHGNNGSRDGDGAAAMRYTETRLTKYGEAMLKDLNKDIVDFVPNFDDTLMEPSVLGTLLPNCLANGTPAGIACGFATNIPPHNLTELYNAMIFMIEKAIKDEEYDATDIAKYISGPDLPDGGIITDKKDWLKIIQNGKGKIPLRCKYEIKEDRKHNKYIEITELPYLVNKLKLVETIENLVSNKKIEGIKEITDCSSGETVNIRIDLKKDANEQIVMNTLLSKTDLKVNVNYNIVVLDNNKEIMQIGILECLEQFIVHSMDVVRRRSQYDLDKLSHDIMILEGVQTAIENIDRVIEVVRTEDEPLQILMEELELNDEQAKYIYDMRISRLSKVSGEKVETDLQELNNKLPNLVQLTEDDEALLNQLIVEFTAMKEEYGDPRRTVIEIENEIVTEDLIKDEELIVTCTSEGNIKSVSIAEYNKQKRNGKGNKGADTKEDEVVVDLFAVNSKDDLLFITNKGRCHTIKAYKIPKTTRTGKGRNLANFITLDEDEWPVKTLATNLSDKSKSIMMITNTGVVKKLAVSQLSAKFNVTKIIGLTDEVEVIDATLVEENDDVMIATAQGMSLRFSCDAVRPMGRSARGVKGIKLEEDDVVVALTRVYPDANIVTIAENGVGKATNESEFSPKSRGCKGIKCHKINNKTGALIACFTLDKDNVLIGTANNKLIRIDSDSIAFSSRVTAGNKLINLDQGDTVVAAACLPEEEIEKEE